MRQKSLSYNALLNTIKTTAAIIFPLITLPYINRVLQVGNMGRISFATSYINYFIQIAGLGITNYAIREGAKVREDKDALNQFCNEIFTINCISTLVSYLFLGLTVLFFPTITDYFGIISILSINIAGSTLGIPWLYSVMEDYAYITFRALIMQIVSLVLMFGLVKSEKDVGFYAFILVISNSGAAIFNLIHSRKYVKLRLTTQTKWKEHIGPIITLFASSVATIIYVNSDTTMIGLISGDYYNGLYSVSVKIYTILKNVLASIFVVTLPRLSFYISKQQETVYRNVLKKILSLVVLMIIPVIVGVNLLCREVILFVGGHAYIDAMGSLQILSIAILFSLIATYISTGILLPLGKEKILLSATVISAIVNILLNFIMIPRFNEIGASITTLISEILVVIIEFPYVKQYLNINVKTMFKSLISVCWIIFICLFLRKFQFSILTYVVLAVFCSAIGYFVLLILMKTEEVEDIIIRLFKRRI